MIVDPIHAAALVGVTLSPVLGRALLAGGGSRAAGRRWTGGRLAVVGAVLVAVLSAFSLGGAAQAWAFVPLLGLLPGTFAYVATRTAFASAVVSLLPLYFGVGPQTLGLPLHAPALEIDRALPLRPAWMLVYGSLWIFILLPILVVRERGLFRRALQGYLLVLVVAYVGFATYPTVAPRPAEVPGTGFAAWSLRLQYALDQEYNCFPSLHVAHSFVSALACCRVHRGVGVAATLWAALIGVSTLFTKQHYLVDVVAGAGAAVAAYALFLRGHPHEAVPESDRRRAPRRALAVVGAFALAVAFFWVLYRSGLVAV